MCDNQITRSVLQHAANSHVQRLLQVRTFTHLQSGCVGWAKCYNWISGAMQQEVNGARGQDQAKGERKEHNARLRAQGRQNCIETAGTAPGPYTPTRQVLQFCTGHCPQ